MTGGIFPPLPPPLPKSAPLPSAARSGPSPPLAMVPTGARAPASLTEAQKAAPVATTSARKFGTVLTNSAAINRAASPVSVPRKATADRDAAARRYYHQYQYTPRHGIQKAYGASSGRVNKPESEERDKENAEPSLGTVDSALSDAAAGGQLLLSAWDNYVHRVESKGSSGQSIWSVTPAELAKIAGTMGASLKYPSGGRGITFQKFYALPALEPTSSDFAETTSSEETQGGSRHTTLDYQKVCSLSAESPSFFPQDNSGEDSTTELMQMLKTSLSSKKVAPHMDWWPGDWKCKKCGNHNFSYRETCKRCRVGRFEDAGFVYAPSSARQGVAA